MDEPDAINVLKDLVNGLKRFADNNQLHEDIQPCNVFVLDTKQVKLVDVLLLNGGNSGFKRKTADFDYNTPLSPQALYSAQNAFAGIGYDREKNDVWALGN